MGITNRQRGRQVLQGLGLWVDVPFDPANFTCAGGMTWTLTPPLIVNRFCRIGNTIIWNFWAGTTVLGGTPGNTIYIACPTPGKVSQYTTGLATLLVQAPAEFGPFTINASSKAGYLGQMGLGRAPFANFTLGSLQVKFQAFYEYGDPVA